MSGIRYALCCAPPLSDELLADYQGRILALPEGPVKDACDALWDAGKSWWELPESDHAPKEHPSGRGKVIELTDSLKGWLDELLPWDHEIKGIESLLDSIDPVADKSTRDMAFHLLWHVKELCLGREPITLDKL